MLELVQLTCTLCCVTTIKLIKDRKLLLLFPQFIKYQTFELLWNLDITPPRDWRPLLGEVLDPPLFLHVNKVHPHLLCLGNAHVMKSNAQVMKLEREHIKTAPFDERDEVAKFFNHHRNDQFHWSRTTDVKLLKIRPTSFEE